MEDGVLSDGPVHSLSIYKTKYDVVIYREEHHI